MTTFPNAQRLLDNLRTCAPQLEEAVAEAERLQPDFLRKFYGQSFKAGRMVGLLETMTAALRSVSPDGRLWPTFEAIIEEGLRVKPTVEADVAPCDVDFRPLAEACLHAQAALDASLACSKALREGRPTEDLPAWGLLLTVFDAER